ncbi:MAG TPA: S1 RNA-binding domain-containing protein [Candidatus Saccharimonadales bacterium]|nr:S1 RNA-binding domain-containing protein [Candidatus Saccharimonadales bacterium]
MSNTTSTTKSSGPSTVSSGRIGATSMAELLQKQKTAFVSLKKGEIITGKVKKISQSEILLDINAKTEAVVLEKERRLMKQLVHLLKVGDTVTASVLNPESDMGYTVVSLRRFLEDTLWGRLEKAQKTQEKIPVIVLENTKGGFLVETPDGSTGFLPNSHISIAHNQQIVGKTIEVVIVELDRDNKKIVLSQKAVSGGEDFKKAKAVLKTGDKITVTVLNIASFGVFVSVPLDAETSIDALIHISEVSWEKTEDLSKLFTERQKIEAVVIGFDNQAKRVDLSIKRLTADPFDEIMKAFPIDKKVTATVTEVTDQGVLLDLGTAEGLIKKDKVPPGTTYTSGQSVTATVSQIDARKRKILLVPVLKEKPIGYR